MRKTKSRAGAPQATAWSRFKTRAAARFAVTKQPKNSADTATSKSRNPSRNKGVLRQLLGCFRAPRDEPAPSHPAPTETSETPTADGCEEIDPHKFIFDRHLGTGGQGGVYAARYPQRDLIPGSPESFALKISKIHAEQASTPELALREYQLHNLAAGHPNIATVYTGFTSGLRAPRAYLLTELLRGGDLYRLCRAWSGGLPKEHALEIAAQISAALLHMHDRGVAHCDLKPDNVLLAENFSVTGPNVVKLVDFGFALKFTTTKDGPIPERIPGGTLEFMCPEALDNQEIDPTKQDIYSLGIMMCLLLRGKMPFNLPEEEQNDRKAHLRARAELDIRRDFFAAQEWNDVAPQLKGFIGMMLNHNPAYRPSAVETLWFLRTFHVVDNG